MPVAKMPPLRGGIAVLWLLTGCYPNDILSRRLDRESDADQGCLALLLAAIAKGPSGSCEPLAAPTGPVTCVGVDEADNLAKIVANAPPGTAILLADGVYAPAGDGLARGLVFGSDDVTMRSASGRADAVILDGQYVTEEVIRIAASRVTIADVTIERALYHAIHVVPPATGDINGLVFRGLHVVDTGGRLIKIDSGWGASGTYADDGSLACSTLELTADGRQRISPGEVACDMGGINANGVRGWTVRNNTFRGLYCPASGVAQHAVHFWAGSRDTLVERNVIDDCARGIGLGGDVGTPARLYPDDPYPGIEPIGHYDGMIRNNFVFANIAQFDTGIELSRAYGVKVFHNSIFHPMAAYSSLDYRYPTTLAEVRNNLFVRMTSREGGQIEPSNNLEGITGQDFVDASTGDLHLAPGAVSAIDQGVVLPEAGDDIDGVPHDVGAPDIGADEQGAP